VTGAAAAVGRPAGPHGSAATPPLACMAVMLRTAVVRVVVPG
jgi:hypothetical protein